MHEELKSPLHTFEVGKPFLEMVGVEVDPLERPLTFIDTINEYDPRTIRREALRMELEVGDQVYGDPEQVACIEQTSWELGLLKPEYPPDESLQGPRRMVTIGAARNAIFDRIVYGVEAVQEGKVTVDALDVLGAQSRRLIDDERRTIEPWASKHIPDWNAEEVTTEADLAAGSLKRAQAERPEWFAEDEDKDANNTRVRARAFPLIAKGPDTYEALTEYVWREGYETIVHAGGLLAVTQAIYTPFMTHEGEAVSLRLGGLPVDFIGCPSPANVVAKRTPDVMATEIVRTLVAAARHHNVRQRLGLPPR